MLCMHFTLYSLHFTLYSLHFTLYSLHFPLYSLHFTLYSLHFTLYSLHFTLYSLHFTLYSPHFTLYSLVRCVITTFHIVVSSENFRIRFSLFSRTKDWDGFSDLRMVKVKSSMARSLPVENLLPQNVG